MAVRNSLLAALALAGLAHLPAGAQTQLQTQDSQLREQTGLRPDVLSFNAGISAERHSNIFQRPGNFDPTPVFGKSTRSDTVVRGLFGIKFDRELSLQRFQINAQVEPTKYMNYSTFDHIGLQTDANWDWAVGRAFFGRVGGYLRRSLSGLDYYGTNEKNLQTLTNLYVTGGMRFTPDWAVIAGVDVTTWRNSLALFNYADYDQTGIEAGVRYARGEQAQFDVVLRHVDGKYPNRQVFDALGNLLVNALDNRFKQQSLLFRSQIRPSNTTRFGGEIGYTTRKYEAVSQRDFSGVTAALNLDWAPTGAIVMRTELRRDIGAQELLTANYVDGLTLAIRPTVQVSGRVAVNGLLRYSNYAYKGDPGFVNSTQAVRKDDVSELGVEALYDLARTIKLTLKASTIRRSSNYSQFDFTDNVIGAGVRATF